MFKVFRIQIKARVFTTEINRSWVNLDTKQETINVMGVNRRDKRMP